MLKMLLPTLAGVSMLMAATPALASEETTLHISYADLDLRRENDIATLKKRAITRIRAACRVGASSIVDARCQRAATAQAMAEIERHRIRYASLEATPAG